MGIFITEDYKNGIKMIIKKIEDEFEKSYFCVWFELILLCIIGKIIIDKEMKQ